MELSYNCTQVNEAVSAEYGYIPASTPTRPNGLLNQGTVSLAHLHERCQRGVFARRSAKNRSASRVLRTAPDSISPIQHRP